MTRAEEIVQKIELLIHNYDYNKASEIIAAELERYAQERVEEDRTRRTADDLYRHSYNRGLEEAAKIPESLIDESSNVKTALVIGIAQRIRALKREVKNG